MTTSSNFSVSGFRVVIAGGEGGIGRALCDGFAAAGAAVISADLPTQTQQAFRRHRFEPLDVCSDDSVQQLCERVGDVHAVINCAGRIERWDEYRVEVFKTMLDVNLVSGLRLANAFRPKLSATGGCLLNFASVASFFGAPQAPGYAAAKAGVASLTKSLAIAFAADGIRVNAIAPGYIRTAMTDASRDNAEYNRRSLERIPIGRWAEPDELVGSAIFLVSPASRLVTGVTLPVDGGYCAA